ncbi:PQQ-binding-like beta-propeller repeat protein [Bacteroidota bacterium]
MKKSIFLFLSLIYCLNIYSQNVSQWRGSERNGIYNEKNLLKEWPQDGPEVLWTAEGIGSGYSSASVTDEMIFITGMQNYNDVLTAIDHKGQVKWKKIIGPSWRGSYPDTRVTPTVEDSKVYVISGQGKIVCFDAITGDEIWSVDGYNKFEGYCTMWGVCESPLIVGDKVVYTPGGDKTTMVSLNKKTGETIWMSESLKDSTAYVSPVLVEYAGKKMIVSILANYFFAVDSDDGKILWKYKYHDLLADQTHWYSPIININTPLYHDGKFFISKGYDHLAAKFSMTKNGNDIKLEWTNSLLDVHLGGMVLIDNHIYAANWLHNRDGNWCCINWDTGEKLYEKKWFNKGSIISADGLLYCYEEKYGNLALVEPTPEEFKILSSFKIDKGKGPYWSHPVIVNGVLYVRHGDFLMAYNIEAS